jgi:hypothetical protein
MTKFFSGGLAPDPLYNGCREHSNKQSVRRRLERMWAAYEPFCPDAHFLSDARSHFVARTWELYLAASLMRRGFKLSRPPAKGPDLLTTIGDRRVWIEAVAPTSGDGSDRVPTRDERGFKRGNIWQGHPPAEEALILRCATAISGKLQKLNEYTEAGIVRSDDACVVALTLGGILDADVSSPDLPIGVKAVFGIGELLMTVTIGSPEREVAYTDRPVVNKRSGANVDTRIFCAPESARISGLLYADCGIWNAPRIAGSDLILVRNPAASVALDPGSLRFPKEEFSVTAGGLLDRQKRKVRRDKGIRRSPS